MRIGQYPDSTLVGLQAWLIEQEQASISVTRLCAVLGEMGLRRKKVCTPLNRTREWQTKAKGLAEASCWNLRGSPRLPGRKWSHHGYDPALWPAERGQRASARQPRVAHWRTVTILGAISSEGWQATMTIAAPTDGEVFLPYLRDVLCPTLRPGKVVVMNLV